MHSDEFHLDRKDELKREGKVILLRRYEGVASVSIRRLDETQRYYALASFEAKNFNNLIKLLNELGYDSEEEFLYLHERDDLENEAKLEVPSEERFKKIRSSLKGHLCQQVSERNFFADKKDLLKRDGRLLRVRIEDQSYPTAERRNILTYKGSSIFAAFNKKLEINVNINNARTVFQFFKELGFSVEEKYRKEREVYDLDGVKIFLDCAHRFQLTMPSYSYWRKFVEIEGSDEQIRGAIEKLGLEDLELISKSYSEIL